MTFKVGDRVEISTLGLELSVRFVIGDGTYPKLEEPYRLAGYSPGDVVCEWLEGKKQKAAAYHPSQLALKSTPATRASAIKNTSSETIDALCAVVEAIATRDPSTRGAIQASAETLLLRAHGGAYDAGIREVRRITGVR
jgi:uncharacterized protein YodC (DUF2158 family)